MSEPKTTPEATLDAFREAFRQPDPPKTPEATIAFLREALKVALVDRDAALKTAEALRRGPSYEELFARVLNAEAALDELRTTPSAAPASVEASELKVAYENARDVIKLREGDIKRLEARLKEAQSEREDLLAEALGRRGEVLALREEYARMADGLCRGAGALLEGDTFDGPPRFTEWTSAWKAINDRVEDLEKVDTAARALIEAFNKLHFGVGEIRPEEAALRAALRYRRTTPAPKKDTP